MSEEITAPTRNTSTSQNGISRATSTAVQTFGAPTRSVLPGTRVYPSRQITPTVQANTTAREGFAATYGTGDPFAILADLFLRTSTGFDPAPPANAGVIAVDPGVSGSGGSSVLIMLVLGIAAVAIWYFYFR